MASWTLAPNLAKREAIVKKCWSNMVVYSIGDQAHAAEASDHNPDARHIVHAIDIMTETDSGHGGAAAKILSWLLDDTSDLQYVIHDRKIYGRDEANGWKGTAYKGSDPHTNHIHVSGKHGSTGKNKATGTGYDTAAEKFTPTGSPCASSSTHPSVPVQPPEDEDMPTADEIAAAVWDPKNSGVRVPAWISKSIGATSVGMRSAMFYDWNENDPATMASMMAKVDALTAAVGALSKAGGVDTAAVVAAVEAAGAASAKAVADQFADLQISVAD